jgi:hypothetical protein
MRKQMKRLTEMGQALALIGAKMPTIIRQIDYPIHKCKPNPAHGKFHFLGSIPWECTEPDPTSLTPDTRRSLKYDTEAQAIEAAIKNGAERIQLMRDCSFVDIEQWRKDNN